METESTTFRYLDLGEITNNVLLNDDVIVTAWNSIDEQTDISGELGVDSLSAGSDDESYFSMDLDEAFATAGYTDEMHFASIEDCLISDPADEVSSEAGVVSISSSSDISSETPVPPKKKRGRKPKSERGLFIPRPRKPPKVRIYEIAQPFEDKEKERKRLCAVNAKKHRDHQKDKMKDLEHEIAAVSTERDTLKREEENLRMKVENQLKELELYKNHFQQLATSSVQILQASPCLSAEICFEGQ